MIETPRLLLRHFTIDDAEAFLQLASVPEIIRYVGNTPLHTVDEARASLRAGPLHDYAAYGFGRFACVWKDSGEVIGFSGLKFMPQFDAVELGYRFLPQYWGIGLATEAARVSIDYAHDVLGLTRLIGLVHPHNAGSANVMRKMGFAVTGSAAVDFIRDSHLDLYERAL